jgi:hypothetical protein
MSEGSGKSLDELGDLIARKNLSGLEVNSLYRFFCSCLYSTIQAGELTAASASLERLLGIRKDAQDAEMGKWGPN